MTEKNKEDNKMSYDKNFLNKFKGKKVIFKAVTSFPDLKIQFVNAFGDYKVKITDSKAFATEIIKIQEVTSFPDVKLQKVTAFGDFEIFME